MSNPKSERERIRYKKEYRKDMTILCADLRLLLKIQAVLSAEKSRI